MEGKLRMKAKRKVRVCYGQCRCKRIIIEHTFKINYD